MCGVGRGGERQLNSLGRGKVLVIKGAASQTPLKVCVRWRGREGKQGKSDFWGWENTPLKYPTDRRGPYVD